MALDLSEYESILSNPDATVEGLNNALNDLSPSTVASGLQDLIML